ncbi:MAG: rod shape-determining protein MreD, partial [Verrucomicrobia bacterium]|nr:rod shape-determining protein MreD [Verrucomicrobiota bacterium]
MNIIVMGLALMGAVLVEMLCPVWVFMGQAKPPLVMSVVLYYALNRPLALMLGAAVLGGVLNDSINALPLGYSALCLAGIGLAARSYRDVVFSGRWITHMVFGALAGVGMTLVLYGLLWLTDGGGREMSGIWVSLKVLGVGVYSVVLVPLVCRAMEQLDRMVGNM